MPIQDRFLCLDLKSLYYFVRSAETGSFSQAALSCGVAQSALSRHIAHLEKLTEGPLFFRTGRGVKLTELGQKLLPKAINLLRETETFINEATNNKNEIKGEVKIGLPPGISGLLLGQLMPFMLRQFPNIRIKVLETHSGEIEVMLANGRLDIGLYNRYRPTKSLNKELMFIQPMCLVGKNSALLGKKEVKFKELLKLNLIVPAHPNNLRNLIEKIAARKKQQIKIALEINPSLATEQLLASANLYTILPRHTVMQFTNKNNVFCVPIVEPNIEQLLFLETTRHHPLNEASQVTEKHIRRFMKKIIKKVIEGGK